MNTFFKKIKITLLLLLIIMSPAAFPEDSEGKKIAYNRAKGNCLACHAMGGGDMPGTIGPPIIFMKSRFPNKADLRAQVWDSTVNNPISAMPPFGKHKILTEEEIDKVVDYIYTL